jgi:hypothetical protein
MRGDAPNPMGAGAGIPIAMCGRSCGLLFVKQRRRCSFGDDLVDDVYSYFLILRP